VITRRKAAYHKKEFSMKKTHILLTVAAVALASCLLFVSCPTSGGGGGGTSNSVTYNGYDGDNTYALTISAAAGKAAYEPKAGDKYELKINSVTVSKGEVDSFDGTTYTLLHNGSSVFTITVDNKGGITNISGTIPVDNGTPIPEPGDITPGTKPKAPSGGSGGGSGSGGATLTFTNEQVYVQDLDISTGNYIFTPSTVSIPNFTTEVGGNGSITNGKFTFSIGTPSKLEPVKISTDGKDSLKVTVSPSSTKGAGLDIPYLLKMNMSMNFTSETSYTVSTEMVTWVYVDTDCTITSNGETQEGVTIKGFTLTLKKGWNAINIIVKATQSAATGTVSTGNLTTCRWVYDPYWDYED